MSVLAVTVALSTVPAATAQSEHSRGGGHQLATPAPPPAVGTSSGDGQPASQQTATPAAGARGEASPAHSSVPAAARRRRLRTPSTRAGIGTDTQSEQRAAAVSGGEAGNQAASGSRERVRHDRTRETRRTLHTPAPTAITTPAAAPAPAAAAASAPAAGTPAVPAPVPGAGTTPASVTHRAATTPRHRAATRPARVNVTAPAAGTGALAPAPLLLGAAATHGASPKVPATGPARTRRGAETPLVKTVTQTVTRIINVVPPLMRALIGGLVVLALALAASSQLAAVRARRLARQRSQLLEDVGLMQAALLPPLPARLGPVGTSAAYRPASGPAAGGDFYDVFALADGRLALIVGDVSGHGRQALPHTTLLRYTLRAYLEAGLSPRAALQTAAPVLERQLGDSFATVALATYHPRERVLVYSCAGHPPPAVLGQESITPIIAGSSPPIGVGRPTGTRQTTVSIPGAALVCFYTDGVVEARVGGQLYGGARLERVLAGLPADATATTVLDRVSAEADKHPDDMAACLLRVEGEPCVPAVRVEEMELDRRNAAGNRTERFLLAGGVHPAEAEQIAVSVRRALELHGRVMLELHLGEGEPEVVLRPQNVAPLAPALREIAGAEEVLG